MEHVKFQMEHVKFQMVYISAVSDPHDTSQSYTYQADGIQAETTESSPDNLVEGGYSLVNYRIYYLYAFPIQILLLMVLVQIRGLHKAFLLVK